jgi:tRNA threonylcarbamoyladenosine dehydratase
MQDAFSRTELLIGSEALYLLRASTVAVIGLGGVGSWAAEALARAGVGGLVLVDEDSISMSNINRQVIATMGSVGRPKAEVMAERIRDINPEARIEAVHGRFDAESAERLVKPGLSYVVDAIDAVSAKLELILRAKALGIPIVSALGTGSKLDPTRLEVSDIADTSVCPLARVIRRELKKRGVDHLTVVYSREGPPPGERRESAPGPYGGGRRSVPGSISFVPSAAGLIAASVVVRDLTSLRQSTMH